jgi:hypothetical protein
MRFNKNLILVFVGSLLFCFSAFSAQKKNKNFNLYAPISVMGEYTKKNETHIFLKVKGAKKLVVVPKKYLLNNTSFLEIGESVSVTMPIGRYVLDNMKSKSRKM